MHDARVGIFLFFKHIIIKAPQVYFACVQSVRFCDECRNLEIQTRPNHSIHGS